MSYVPNPNQTTEPTTAREVVTAAQEFREIKSVLAQGLRFPAADSSVNRGELPPFAQRAGRFLGFNSITGAPEVGPLLTVPVGSIDSQFALYSPAGAGAVVTNVQAKLRQIVSVRDFGAIGNGIADDRAAIQAAVDAVHAAGGGTVYIPEGTYLMASIVPPYYTVRARTGVSVIGEGPRSIIRMANNLVNVGPGITFLYDHTNPINDVRYSNFTIDWNGQNNPGAVSGNGNITRIGTAAGATNWHVDRITFLNPGGHHNIYIASSGGRNSITNCTFLNAGRAVLNNTVVNDHSSIYVRTGSALIANNIFLCENLNDTVATAIEVHNSNNIVQNNIVHGYNLGIIAASAFGLNARNNKFCDNILSQVIEGLRLYTFDSSFSDLYVFDNNLVITRALPDGASFGIRSSQMLGSMPSGELRISNNAFLLSNPAASETSLSIGIDVREWRTIKIDGNSVYNYPGEAVRYQSILHDATLLEISNNKFIGNGQTTAFPNSKRTIGLFVADGRAATAVVKNNFILASAVYGTAATWGYQSWGNVPYLVVEDNIILGQSASSIRREGVDATAITFIKHTGPEHPAVATIRATLGSEYRSNTSSRVWHFVNTADNGTHLGWRSVEYRASAPTTNIHYRGDRVWNIAPAVGSPRSWVCTADGNPGTWVSEGNL